MRTFRSTRCRCSLGFNPACPVDHYREAEQVAERRDAKLADLEWVSRTLAELPQLSYYRGWQSPGGRDVPDNFRGADTLRTLLTGDDAALLAMAKDLRARLVATAEEEAEQSLRDEEDARWAA